MREVVERKSIKLNIPVFIDDYYCAFKSGDTEECDELKDHFHKVFSRLDAKVKVSFSLFIEKHLVKAGIDHKKDLGLVFGDIITK